MAPRTPQKKRGRDAPAAQHPGEVLAQILDDTPPGLAASWLGVSAAELSAVLEGRAPMTAAMAAQAGAIFGTGSAPWLEMQAVWDAAHAESAPAGGASR